MPASVAIIGVWCRGGSSVGLGCSIEGCGMEEVWYRRGVVSRGVHTPLCWETPPVDRQMPMKHYLPPTSFTVSKYTITLFTYEMRDPNFICVMETKPVCYIHDQIFFIDAELVVWLIFTPAISPDLFAWKQRKRKFPLLDILKAFKGLAYSWSETINFVSK